MSRIQLLTFDLDDTLWDVKSIIVRAEAAMMDWLNAHYPALTAQIDSDAFRALRAEVYLANPDIRHDLTALRLRVLETALRRSGHDGSSSEEGARGAFEAFFQARNTVEFFPDVLNTLEALKQDYALYALSNGNADIRRIGLSHVFSLHLSAASVGAAKPDPAIYLKALEHAGLSAAEAIHIGDHPEQDIEAAQKVGMKTIWVNFQGQPWPLEKRADGEIAQFAELPAVIRNLAGA